MYCYEVVTPYPLRQNLMYQSEIHFSPGAFVFVPLRNKVVPAVVLKKISTPKKSIKLKNILLLKNKTIGLDSARLKWLQWLAGYYHYHPAKVIHTSFPFVSVCSEEQFMRKQKREAKKQMKNIEDSTQELALSNVKVSLPVLTEEQSKCIRSIQSYKNKGFAVHLIHGVTGSGKTEIYFRLIEPAVKQGKSVLVLVPEIALTPQHIERFSQRFSGQVACLHSGLTIKEKKQQWTAVLEGRKKILIGPRSALFCPLPDPAWIIVDEEHESHFKQEENLKYHGRDCAVYLGKCLNIPVVLASATPSLESWQNAQAGKYVYHSLKKKVFQSVLPTLEVVDMTKQIKEPGRPWWMSDILFQSVKDSLSKKEQVALFLNRRGEKGFVFCSACGFQFFCPNCDISLTQHQQNYLLCHYCGFQEEQKNVCSQCGEQELRGFGLGTQALQKELSLLFPEARVARADRDEVSNHKEWAGLIKQIEKREVDVLIGTQMIAKGLDFPNLNLVGVILADQGLSRPDFRTAEKHFQLITQMAGRAGRRQKPGRVILQTFNPAHFLIQSLHQGSYLDFVSQELKHRKKRHYPPFGKLTLIRVQSLVQTQAYKGALKVQQGLEKKVQGLQILGPAPAPIFRLRNKYRYHLLLKSQNAKVHQEAGEWLLYVHKPSTGVQVYINRDPMQML